MSERPHDLPSARTMARSLLARAPVAVAPQFVDRLVDEAARELMTGEIETAAEPYRVPVVSKVAR